MDITGEGGQIISYVRPTDHKDFGLLVCPLLLQIKASMHGRVSCRRMYEVNKFVQYFENRM